MRIELTQSGGLLPGQDVTLRRVRVGRVRAVDVEGDKVVAVAELRSGVRIPKVGDVRVASLSAAGEQYLDFLPSSENGPYLADGDVVGHAVTSSAGDIAELQRIAVSEPHRRQGIAAELLAAAVAAARRTPADRMLLEVREDHASRGLLKIASERRADLIVLGSSGHNAFQRAILGSTAGKVLTHAECPVLVVPARIAQKVTRPPSPEPAVAACALVPEDRGV